MNSEICLSCEAIERHLGEEEERVHALRGISLDLEPGIIHAVVGPPAAAKVRCSIFSVCSIRPTPAGFQSNRSRSRTWAMTNLPISGTSSSALFFNFIF